MALVLCCLHLWLSDILISVSPHDNRLIFYVSRRIPLLPCRLPQPLIASFSADFPFRSDNIYEYPRTVHSFQLVISLLYTAHISDTSARGSRSGFLRYTCRNRPPRLYIQEISAVIWDYQNSNVPNFCNKIADCNQTGSFGRHPFINIWALHSFSSIL